MGGPEISLVRELVVGVGRACHGDREKTRSSTVNDLTYKTDPHSRPIWDIYPAVPKPIRLGEVEAADEREAIEKAAEKFQQDPAILVVMRRP
jgi:hypothetical protein